jgi:hypothetical protein
MRTISKLITAFLILNQTFAFGAGVPEKHPTDTFQIGVGSSSATKNFVFDQGLGASNLKLGMDSSSVLNLTGNSFSVGDGSNNTKKYIANIGNGSTNPALKWNNTLNQWQFSNDGTNYQSIGSGGGGSKNYLSAITASAGAGTPNTGNGNFEFGTTGGWSLAHSTLTSRVPTSTASAGTPFSSSAGGSSASGNLSLSAISSGQIQGLYSGSVASSAASTAGDMLISSAFYIDKEDQAKMMTFKFYYNVNAGSANMNFSGTSSNTYAIYVYDVTNGDWIQPAGVYNLVQNSGTGYATGTFQTTSNSTQYQIALVNINASSGSFTLYVDDFSVGPQTAPMGPAMSDPIAYTPTFSGLGTVTTNAFFWERRGKNALIAFNFTMGTGTATLAKFTLPAGLSVDTSVGSSQMLKGEINATNTPFSAGLIWFTGDTTNVYLVSNSASYGNGVNGNTWAAGTSFTGWIEVPIAGWSSNVQMSPDTDTRVIQFNGNYTNSTSLSTSPLLIPWVTLNDTAAGNSGGSYTVPVSGKYQISATVPTFASSGGLNALQVYKNGSGINIAANNTIATSSTASPTISGSENFVAGDVITIKTTAVSGTMSLSGQTANVSIVRVSGPAVVAATESVNAKYNITTNTAVSAGAVVPYNSKEIDSHNAFNTSTGLYTVPVSGTYLISDVTQVSVANANVFVKKNGSSFSTLNIATTGGNPASGSTLIKCNAGDTLGIYLDASATVIATGNGNITSFSLYRVGN